MKSILAFLISLLFTCNLFAQQNDVVKSFMFSPTDTTMPAISRSYTVAVPSGYSAATPADLIVFIHGYNSDVTFNREDFKLDSIAEANDVIIVYPKGTICEWITKPLSFLPESRVGWNAGIIEGDFDDAAFISQVVDSVISDYNIEPSRMFCAGVSNGGMMSMKFIAEYGNRFAAAATVIGLDSATPSSPIPLLSILGLEDPIIDVDGFPGIFPDWNTIESKWIIGNACASNYISDTLPDINMADSSWVEKRVYNNCNSRGNLTEYLIHNGGHTIPNSSPCTAPPAICDALGFKNYDFDPSIAIWDFFKSRTIFSVSEEKAIGSVKVFPNPSSNNFTFQCEDNNQPFDLSVLDINGNVVYTASCFQNCAEIIWDASSFAQGMYFYTVRSNQSIVRGKVQLIK